MIRNGACVHANYDDSTNTQSLRRHFEYSNVSLPTHCPILCYSLKIRHNVPLFVYAQPFNLMKLEVS